MAHTQLGPVAFTAVTPDERQALTQVNYMTVGDIDGDDLFIFKNGQWLNLPLFSGTRHDGDVLTWNQSAGIWVPASAVNVIGPLSGQRAFFLGDNTKAIEVRRTWKTTGGAVTGSGSMSPWGDHTLPADTNYRVEIDTAGIENAATFRWSTDGGATWRASLVPVSAIERIELEYGLFVLFGAGKYVVGDYWLFTGIARANQIYAIQVDTLTNVGGAVGRVLIGGALYVGPQAYTQTSLITSASGQTFQLAGVNGTMTIGIVGGASYFDLFTLGGATYRFTDVAFDMTVGGVALPIVMRGSASPATPAASNGTLYAATVGSVQHPFWKDEAAATYDLAGGAAVQNAIFGDGSDGALTVATATTTTLTRSMNYSSITLTDATSVLVTAGWTVSCSGTVTLNGGTIQFNGGAGGNGAAIATGGAAGVTTTANDLGTGQSGTLGRTGVVGAGVNALGGTNSTGDGGSAGQSGNGGAGSGGGGGTGASGGGIVIRRVRQLSPVALMQGGNHNVGGGAGGADGASGAGNGAVAGAGGGGGGGGGGVLGLWAKTINATTGNITALGGKGGNGGTSVTNNCGGGGGGGAGGGGVVYLVYQTLTTGGTISAAGGAKGTLGGGGGGSGLGGTDGVLGNAGWVIKCDLGAGTITSAAV